ncbi:MAG TPA: DUF3574 domain-containing protein [Rhizomicrobium sp.]|nr:DUF3574 domain-containing protein [Rhizomicrobium sp.]
MSRLIPCLLLLAQAVSAPAGADAACPLPGQKEMLIAKLYFGQDTAPSGGRPLTPDEWRSFLADTVTPRFPEGFTVYDASGQWRNPKTRAIAREETKVIEVAAENTAAFRQRIEEVAARYQAQFRQESVGVVTRVGCGRF